MGVERNRVNIFLIVQLIMKAMKTMQWNQSIKECARMILAIKCSYMTLDDLWGHTSFDCTYIMYTSYLNSEYGMDKN